MTTDNLVRGHTVLTTSQLRDVRAALDEQRAFRQEQLTELDAIAPATVAPDEALTDVLDSLRTAARHALTEIDAAFHRLDDGHYGICTACNQPIALERLEVLPSAAQCMSCQRAAEERRR